jgi:ribosome-binding protein aMBF1 (putative translation factor)
MHVSAGDCKRHLSRLARSSPVQTAKAVASILARERLRQNMSHETLAGLAQVHRSTVSRTESGKMNPTFLVVQALSDALGLRLSEVVAEAESRVAGPKK